MKNTTPSRFLNSFLRSLNDAEVWNVVLRNHSQIAEGDEKDVDMLADARSYQTLQRLFLRTCEEVGFVSVRCEVHGKSLSMTAVPRDKAKGRPVSIHFICFVSLHTSALYQKVNGLSKKVRSRQIRRVHLKVGDLECWAPAPDQRFLFLLAKLLQKAKPRYVDELRTLSSHAEDEGFAAGVPSELEGIIENVADASSVRRSMRVMLPNVVSKCGLGYVIFEWICLLCANIRSWTRRRGILIFFSGPDGAGKTTARSETIRFLEDTLQLTVFSCRGLNPLNENHMLGRKLTRIQHQVRNVGDATADELENERRDREPPAKTWKFKLRRFAGLCFILCQYHVSYVIARLRNFRGVSVVVDTSVYDRFIKAHRPRFRWLERISIPFLPGGDAVFRLTAAPAVIVARKPELSVEELESYYSTMDEIIGRNRSINSVTIRTEEGPAVAADAIADEVVKLLHRRYR